MNEVIAQAIGLINQILKSSSESYSNFKISQLVDTRNDLNRLLELDSSKNDWTRLFCRQLKLVMNYNKLPTDNFWLAAHNDILYILQNSNDQQNKGSSSDNFCERMKLEAKLEQREIEFQQTFGERRSLNELLFKHRKLYSKYLDKCIFFHSKIQVQGLVENIDDLLHNVCELTDVCLSSEDRKNLEEKLKCIEIPLDCSNRSLHSLFPSFSKYDNSNKTVNPTLSNFLPSTEQIKFQQTPGTKKIEHILYKDRWIVILGDPGSAKTTLLRWIMHTFAEKAYPWIEKSNWGIYNTIPFRVPILIRIGEFAKWLESNQTNTLIDYIGKHTWFSESYCDEDSEIVLKELVYHGHALILIDGLDEISDAEYRGKIVDLVRKFIDECARTSNFLSPFDNEMIRTENPYDPTGEIFDFELPSRSIGNQIIVTSRIIGYQLNSLHDGYIFHYSLSLMDNIEAKQFVCKWMSQVENEVLKILQREISGMFRKTMKTLSEKRCNSIEVIFKNNSQSLILNPLLLSLICIYIFQSSNEFHCKSRIEVYHYAVQSTLILWKKQKPKISEDILTNFLIDLAFYLHLQSSSGLIDTFDMEHLCCLTLKQYFPFDNRQKLHNYAKELISLLDSNVGIMAERGLQVFGFLHLTFQEYFVSQSLIRGFSIETIVKRILSVVINPRFRESILLALGWISSKFSMNDYDKFCNLLVSPTKDYAIPFGTLIFFDAFNDLNKLPSNEIIFTALNTLFDHSSNLIAATYLIPNLIKLEEDVIIQWIELRLNDEKYLSKFCEYLLKNIFKSKDKINDNDSNLIPSVIYKQLLLLHKKIPSSQFIIDQTLRRIVSSNKLPTDIFKDELFSFTLPEHVHPLILSIIIAVCGGIDFENKKDIYFSIKNIHRHSCILIPINDYLSNQNQTHSIKIQILIKQYEDILKNASQSDIFVDIVDTFVALICLQGFSQPLIYQKYQGYQALVFALEKFKHIWFYLKTLFDCQSQMHSRTDASLNISKAESIINEFISQSDQSNEKYLAFSLSCAAAWNKLNIGSTSDWFQFDIFHKRKLDQYLECQPEFHHYIIKRKIEQMTKDIHPLQIFQHKPFFLLTFLPQSLQPLYYYMINNSINKKTDSSLMVILLSHCLIYLNTMSTYNANFYLAVLLLLPMFKEHMLENYALVLFEEKKFVRCPNKDCTEFFKAMKDRIFIDQPKDWKILIDIESQRINEAKNVIQNNEKDLRFFAASICLARLFQEQYLSCNYDCNLSAREGEEIHLAIMNIINPIIRIIALSIILNMKDPFIFNEEQRDQLTMEMIDLLKSSLPDLSLSISTLLFIRCYMICQNFPQCFQHMIHVIGEKLNKNFLNEHTEEQEAVFIALQYLNNSILSPYLFEFLKRTKNLSDLCQFNSTIFFEYFISKTTFDSSNLILLSSMYLTELSFDVQILKLYNCNDQKRVISPLNELNQLWKKLSEYGKIMSYEVAVWITNYLQIFNKKELNQVKNDVSYCITIEKKALPIIEKWINYRMNEDLKFFAYYAVLQMIKEGLDIPDLTNIINEIIDFDKEFQLKYFIEVLFNLQPKNSAVIRQILFILHKNVPYFEQIYVWIYCKEVLEIIFNLEFERINSNMDEKSQNQTRPYLLMIVGCSKDLEFYIKEYLFQLIKLENKINEEHVAIIIKWIIQLSIQISYKPTRPTEFSIEFYQWIFTLIHNQQFPLIQKAVLNGLNSIFISFSTQKECFYMQDQTIIHLEKMILSWNTYSDDVIAICLLAYGNYILELKSLNQNRNIPDEIQNILMDIFKTSTSEFLSIRAGFCLFFSHYSSIRYKTISNWFENNQSITFQRRYNILVQLTLYENLKSLISIDMEIILQFIDIFINDFYVYLCNKLNVNYLADPMPNYVNIAVQICKNNLDVLRNAIQNSSFGKDNFLKEYMYYFYQTNNSSDRKILLEFYPVFVGITNDLIDMLKWIESVQLDHGWHYLEHIKQISDRNIIEKIFKCLDSTSCDIESRSFSPIFGLLIRLTQTDVISLLEVHQHILSIIDTFSYQNNGRISYIEENIFDFLLNLSCIRKISLSKSQEKLFTESDINEKFRDAIQSHIKNSALYLRRNYFFINFRSIINSL